MKYVRNRWSGYIMIMADDRRTKRSDLQPDGKTIDERLYRNTLDTEK